MIKEQIVTEYSLEDNNRTSQAENHDVGKCERERQLIRRLDWRFLLLNPKLKQVAYVGRPDKSLISSLQKFSDSLHILQNSTQISESLHKQLRFDLLVIRSMNWSEIESALPLLKAGGQIYWEVERFLAFTSLVKFISNNNTQQNNKHGKMKHPFTHFQKYVDALKRSGLCNISVHWHRPDFDHCLEIIPLSNQTALNYLFNQDRSDWSGRLKTAVGRQLVKTGIFSYTVPCFSIVASKE